MIRILLVDDQPLFREGLRKVIDDWDDFEVVGEAANGQQAVTLSQELLPDIVLMDINMPIMNGIEAVRQIRERDPSMRIVMLTVSDEDSGLFEAIKNGAQGYLLKDTPTRRLRSELKGTMNDETPLSGAIASKILMEFRQVSSNESSTQASREDSNYETLTMREKEVLALLTEGLSNRDIADRLFVSEKTVKKHLNNIFAKLHLNNRAQAAIYAIKAGLD